MKNAGKEELEILRKKIDNIDEEIVSILAKRMHLSEKIGKYKAEHGIEIHQEDRFAEVLNHVMREAEKQKISAECICAIYKVIHIESKKLQIN